MSEKGITTDTVEASMPATAASPMRSFLPKARMKPLKQRRSTAIRHMPPHMVKMMRQTMVRASPRGAMPGMGSQPKIIFTPCNSKPTQEIPERIRPNTTNTLTIMPGFFQSPSTSNRAKRVMGSRFHRVLRKGNPARKEPTRQPMGMQATPESRPRDSCGKWRLSIIVTDTGMV